MKNNHSPSEREDDKRDVYIAVYEYPTFENNIVLDEFDDLTSDVNKAVFEYFLADNIDQAKEIAEKHKGLPDYELKGIAKLVYGSEEDISDLDYFYKIHHDEVWDFKLARYVPLEKK